MKGLIIGVLTLISSAVSAAPVESALELLQQTNVASEKLNYEYYYIRVGKNSIDPIRYRHSSISGKEYGELTYLSGIMREIIRRNDEISYFEAGLDPFTIPSEQIVAPLPILHTDFSRLKSLYSFVLLGRGREAGLPSQVVRISPKNGKGFSYILWLDDKSKLILRSDLVDEHGELIEQIRSIKLTVSSDITKEMNSLMTMKLPPVIKNLNRNKVNRPWQIAILPQGYYPVAHNSYNLLDSSRPVENHMFTDGLFSFAIYLSKADNLSMQDQSVRHGRKTFYSKVVDGTEIVVVGEIPSEVAKDVANSVRLTPPPRGVLFNRERK